MKNYIISTLLFISCTNALLTAKQDTKEETSEQKDKKEEEKKPLTDLEKLQRDFTQLQMLYKAMRDCVANQNKRQLLRLSDERCALIVAVTRKIARHLERHRLHLIFFDTLTNQDKQALTDEDKKEIQDLINNVYVQSEEDFQKVLGELQNNVDVIRKFVDTYFLHNKDVIHQKLDTLLEGEYSFEKVKDILKDGFVRNKKLLERDIEEYLTCLLKNRTQEHNLGCPQKAHKNFPSISSDICNQIIETLAEQRVNIEIANVKV